MPGTLPPMRSMWVCVAALLVGLAGCAPVAEPVARPVPSRASTTAEPSAPAEAPRVRTEIGFTSRESLREHFAKHGRDFPGFDQAEYLRAAQTLRDTEVKAPVFEAARRDGVITRFHATDGTFIAFNPNGRIRTFFKPDDGRRYFERQARR